MRIWTTDHTFEWVFVWLSVGFIKYSCFFIFFRHPWDTVVQAVWRKYPNPMNPSVVGIDIVDRKVCPETSVLHTHRLISCKWGLPGWAEKLLGRDTSIASEHSQLDPKNKSFTLKSKNVSACLFVCKDCIYQLNRFSAGIILQWNFHNRTTNL